MVRFSVHRHDIQAIGFHIFFEVRIDELFHLSCKDRMPIFSHEYQMILEQEASVLVVEPAFLFVLSHLQPPYNRCGIIPIFVL